MKNRLILLTNLIFVFIVISVAQSKADVLVICNKNIPETKITKKEIKEIFTGKKRKIGATKIHFVLYDDPVVHKTFLKKYVDKTPMQFERYWKLQLFTGKGASYKKFKTAEKLLEYIASHDGAIGYIDTNTSLMNVITLEIQ